MLETFLAGFLGVCVGSGLISFLFYRAYLVDRAMAQDATDKLLKLASGELRPTKTGSVLSLFKNDDDKPLN